MMDLSKLLSLFEQNREAVDAKIQAGIEANRKGTFTISFGDSEPKTVTVTQKQHDFKFGCNAFMIDNFETPEKEQIYREKFAAVFNQAVVPFYWNTTEPTEGHLRFHADSEPIYRRPSPDRVLDFCRDYAIEPKGHCLTWHLALPDWLQQYGEVDRKKILTRRFEQIAAEYAHKIPSFDIVNESASSYAFGEKVLFPDYDAFGLTLGQRFFPDNEKILNETNGAIWESSRTGRYNPFEAQINRLLSEGIPFDSLGVQFHIFAGEKTLAQEEFRQNYLDPMTHFRILERLSRYGKPLHISEITIPSQFHSTPENEEAQALMLKELYSLWFSIEQMRSIVWWNLVDGYAAYCRRNTCEGENTFGGGLLDYDMREKPAYRMLDELVNHTWHTQLTKTATDTLSFRGFYGTYEIVVTAADGTVTKTTHRFSKNAGACKLS